eukprot:GFUD01001468.1.p1 GENE.GFUD01001468.1~~GFUD01001468.1.p1  ORF type:complete len:474 (-),score=69.20 GFUD01001468.1:201-1622(-)
MGRLVCLFLLFGLVINKEQVTVTTAASGEEQNFPTENAIKNTANSCFCKLDGVLEDCPCTAVTIDQFNSKFHPSLLKLLETDYFRYFQVDFTVPCKWGWDAQCTSPNCAVDTCKEEDLPVGINNGSEEIRNLKSEEGYLARLLTRVYEIFPFVEPFYLMLHELLASMNLVSSINPSPCSAKDPYPQYHDVAEKQFCKLDPMANPATCDYVDLLTNIEKFTGYSGAAAHRVWNTIYDELCFHPETEDKTLYLTSNTAKSMCLEKRAFYKLVSGLHSSISVHLCSKYLLEEGGGQTEPVWGRNLEEFKRRFSPETTEMEGPERLKNIYFLYLVEMRAVEKVGPLLERLEISSGDAVKDQEIVNLVQKVISELKSFPFHFDESELFKDETLENKELLELYKQNFMKISEMMDCLGCERCKVWGKLQVTGIGTALKILFTPLEEIKLTKHELVALLNALGRHSTSISELDSFRVTEV